MKTLTYTCLLIATFLSSQATLAYNSYCAIGSVPPGYKTFFHQANWSSFDFTNPEVLNYVHVYTELEVPVYASYFTWYEGISHGGVETHYYVNPSDGTATGSGWIAVDDNYASCWVSGPISNTPPVSVWFTPDSTVGVGSAVAVNWSSSGASSCTYNGGSPMPGGAFSGSYSFTASASVTYTVSCLGPLGEGTYGPLGGIGQDSATLTVVDYCSSSYISNTDSVATNLALNNWYVNKAYERGVSIFCNPSTGTHYHDYFSDSFGYVGSWYTPTQDPCKTTLAGGLSQLRAGLHSHPYFNTSAEYTAGVGCHGDQSFKSSAQLASLNLDNRNFGVDDGAWVLQTSTPLYLLVPLGNSVKRKDTVSGSGTTVFP